MGSVSDKLWIFLKRTQPDIINQHVVVGKNQEVQK